MATIVATQSGNWSAGSTWVGGQKPGAVDVAQTANFVVAIDENVTCVQLEPTGSGRFTVSAGGITLNANVVMNSTYGGGGVRCDHAGGTVVINGAATGGAGTTAYGALNSSTGTLTVATAIGNGFGPGGTTTNQAAGVHGLGVNGQTTKVKAVQSGPYGAVGISGAVLIEEDANHNTAQFRKTANGATLTLVHSSTTDPDYPAEGDVRSGVSYANGDMTGSCAVPDPNQVAYGVAVDDAAGTAVLTPDALWDEALSGHLTIGSTGRALNDAGAVADPWTTDLPGSYTSGQAGWILGERLDAKVSSVSGGGAGSGAIEWVYTLTEAGTGAPIVEADVWVTADSAGSVLLASGRTNGSGEVTFYLDAGAVYVWRQKAGWNFVNPDVELVA
jgi:hypothetical protein